MGFDLLEPTDPEAIGPYRLFARLGAGGMGRVYLARSAQGQTVAVKAIRPEFAEDREFRVRFRREVAAARAVGGSYTAPVVDADTEATIPWLATSYVSGPSLAETVVRHGPMDESAVCALGAGLAEALTAIHGSGLVHRDLKPSNVLLAASGPRVIDFGIARAAEGSDLTGTGIVIGTPAFMSPEQASGRPLGPASDVYSLGSVLVFAATGRGPHGPDGSGAGMLYKVAHDEPDLSGLPDLLAALLPAVLAKDPDERLTPREIASILAPDGVSQALDADWMPGPVTAALARHQATVIELSAPLRQPAPADPRRRPTVPDADAPHRQATPTTQDGPRQSSPGTVQLRPPGFAAAPQQQPPVQPPPPALQRSPRRGLIVAAVLTAVLALVGVLATALVTSNQNSDGNQAGGGTGGMSVKAVWSVPSLKESDQLIGSWLTQIDVIRGDNNGVKAYSIESGRLDWQVTPPPGTEVPCTMSPTLSSDGIGTIAFGRDKEHCTVLAGVSSQGGKVLWQVPLIPDGIGQVESYISGDVVTALYDRLVVGLDPKTGNRVWSHEPRAKDCDLEPTGTTNLVLVNEFCPLETPEWTLSSYDPHTGKQLWSRSEPDKVLFTGVLSGLPAVVKLNSANDDIRVYDEAGEPHKLGTQSGTTVSLTGADQLYEAQVIGDTLIVQNGNPKMYAFATAYSLKTGQQLWTYQGENREGAALVTGPVGHVYAVSWNATAGSQYVELDLATGKSTVISRLPSHDGKARLTNCRLLTAQDGTLLALANYGEDGPAITAFK